MNLVLAVVGLLVFLGLIPALVARSKSRLFGIWWLYGGALFPIALVHSILLKKPARAIGSAPTDLTAAQVTTREGFRKLAEDAGVKGEVTSSGWRPIRFEQSPQKEKAERPVPIAVAGTTAKDGPAVPVDQWIRVGQVFSPAAPINRQDLFAGRHEQMESLIDIAFERGQHAIVVGERGVGKTSMATVMTTVFGAKGTKLAVKVSCDVTDTYESIWRKVLDEFDFVAGSSEFITDGMIDRIRSITGRSARDLTLTPNDVCKALRLVTAVKECVIFLDEFERLRDRQTTAIFAETLQMLSDQQVAATVIIVGVADSIQELLSEHSTIEPALVQVHMPRMSPSELQEIVRRALSFVEMSIEDEALDLITRISSGLPHFTHLIAQIAARAAIDDRDQSIATGHVHNSLEILVDKTQGTILGAYNTATFSHRKTLFPQVLLAAALAETDDHGYFAAADLVVPLSHIARRPYDIPAFSRHLHALANANRGHTLQRKGSDHRYRFRFANPLLQPYVLMRGLVEKTIEADDVIGLMVRD